MNAEPTPSQKISWLESDLDEAKRRMNRLDALWGIGFIAAVLVYPLVERPQAVVGCIFLAALGIIQVVTAHMRYFYLDLKLITLKEVLRQLQHKSSGES